MRRTAGKEEHGKGKTLARTARQRRLLRLPDEDSRPARARCVAVRGRLLHGDHPQRHRRRRRPRPISISPRSPTPPVRSKTPTAAGSSIISKVSATTIPPAAWPVRWPVWPASSSGATHAGSAAAGAATAARLTAVTAGTADSTAPPTVAATAANRSSTPMPRGTRPAR